MLLLAEDTSFKLYSGNNKKKGHSKPTIKCTTKSTFSKRDELQSTFGHTSDC